MGLAQSLTCFRTQGRIRVGFINTNLALITRFAKFIIFMLFFIKFKRKHETNVVQEHSIYAFMYISPIPLPISSPISSPIPYSVSPTDLPQTKYSIRNLFDKVHSTPPVLSRTYTDKCSSRLPEWRRGLHLEGTAGFKRPSPKILT